MINVYPAAATDFSTLGVMTLEPASCTIEERAGGLLELEMTHPIDADLKWTYLQPGNIIKAPCAIREAPILRVNDNVSSGTATKMRAIYKVTTDGRRLSLRTQPNESAKVLHAYKPGTEIVRLSVSGNWANVVVCSNGQSGYMWAGNLIFVRNESETVSADTEKPSTVVGTQQTREQLFRIYSVAPDSASGMVTVKASHVFYDLKGIVCTKEYAPESVAANEVLATILANLSAEHGFTFHCMVTDAISGDYSGVSVVRALLDPEIGIVPLTHAQIIRDNYDVYILPDTPMDRGMEIRHRKNLIGAVLTTDASSVVTRIRPVGKDKDGNRLFITDNGGWVESANKALYPISLDAEVEYDVTVSKDKDSKFKTDAEARAELKRLAEADFANGADAATVGLEVEFAALENTEEYKAYAKMQRLFLYDQVRVIAAYAGINAKLRVNGYVFDCLLRRYDDVYVGDISSLEQVTYGYEIASGTVSGTKLLPNSVNANTVMRRATIGYAKISQAAVEQLSADSLVAVKAEIQRLVAGQITTDQLYADLAAIAVAQITTANISKANIDWATIANLTAAIADIANAQIGSASIGTAQIKDAKIDWAKIYDLTADTAIITEGVGGELYIARLAVTEANMTSLTVGELMLKAADGSFKRLTVDADGNVTAETVQVEGSNVADNTISGGKLIENTITARELNVESIFADTALIRAIKAANIDVSDLFAAEATISALNSWLIKADTIQSLQGQLNLWASDKITAAVSGVEIGGTNLLYCSADMGYSNSRGFLFNSAGAATVGTAGEAGSDGSRLVTNANSNLRFYHTRLAVTAGETFTISAEYKIVSGSPDIRLQISFYKTATDWTSAGAFADAGTETALGDGWVRRSFTATAPAGSVTLMPFWRSGADNASFTHSYYIRHPKLERGNKATGWNQNPEELRIGSGILLDEYHIRMDAPYMDINVSGTEGDMHIDEDGISAGTATFKHLNCAEVMKNYAGNMTLAANSDVSVIGAALNNKCLTGSMTITLNGDVNGFLEIRGVVGRGNVTINGNGHTLNGHVWLNNNAVNVTIIGLTISATGAQRGCLYESVCQSVTLRNCIFNSNSLSTSAGTSQGVRVYYSSLLMQNCEFYNTVDYNMVFGACADVAVQNCKGDGAKCVYTDGASVKWSGTRPSGTWGKGIVSLTAPADLTTLTINTGSATPTETPVTTARYTASVTGTYYPSGHWIGNSGLIQGRYDTTRHYGCMWFAASALKGKTIKSATLTIKRIASAGKSSSVNVTLYTSPVTGKSGNPTTNTVSLGTLGKAGNGETVIVNLPISAIAAIASGGALMLDPGDTANASNKRYSANYARFEGKDDGTPPVLTVTYQ